MDRSIALDERKLPSLPLEGACSTSIPLSKLTASEMKYLSEFIADALRPNEYAFLWVTLWGVFDHNPHLFYKLRESYGERRMLHTAPGHYFLKYEFAEMASFIFLALVNNWDFYIFSEMYINVFGTHDGFLDIYGDSETIESFKKRWATRS